MQVKRSCSSGYGWSMVFCETLVTGPISKTVSASTGGVRVADAEIMPSSRGYMIQEAAEYKIQLNAFAQGRFNGARYFVSKDSLGNGLLNKNPCISLQFNDRSRRNCSSVSTPSATTLSFKA